MPDLLEQLHEYAEWLDDSVEPIRATEVTERPVGVIEIGRARSPRQWPWFAAAAVIALFVAIAAALIIGGGQGDEGTGLVSTVEEESTSLAEGWERIDQPFESGRATPVRSVSVAAGPDSLLALSQGDGIGLVWESPDGRTWEALVGLSLQGDISDTALSYVGDRWYIAGPGGLWSSTNGRDWTEEFSMENDSRAVALAEHEGRLVVVGSIGPDAAIWWSDGSETWNEVLPPVPRMAPDEVGESFRGTLNDVVATSTGFIATGGRGDAGFVLRSADGIDWQLDPGFPLGDVGDTSDERAWWADAITHRDGSTWVAGIDGTDATALWREDGSGTWTRVPTPTGPVPIGPTAAFARSENGFVLVGPNVGTEDPGQVWVSEDGEAWLTAVADEGTPLDVVAWNGGFVAVGTDVWIWEPSQERDLPSDGAPSTGSDADTADAFMETPTNLEPGWHEVPAPPFELRMGQPDTQQWAWTGRYLIVWSGQGAEPPAMADDGWLHDIETGEWRRIPDAPINPRVAAVTAWTGSEFVVWGGATTDISDPMRLDVDLADGAAYDPATDSWRTLSTGPLAGGPGYAAVWTGDEVGVWGGFPMSGLGFPPSASEVAQFPRDRLNEGALYDPATDTWRAMADSPLDLSFADAVWTGSEVLVWGGQSFSGPDYGNLRGDLLSATYDPATDAWRELRDAPLSTQAADGAWAATGLLVTNYTNSAGLLDPVSGEWRTLPDTSLQQCEASPVVGAVGALGVVSLCGESIGLDLATAEWIELRLADGDDWFPHEWRTAGGSMATFGNTWDPYGEKEPSDVRALIYVPE